VLTVGLTGGIATGKSQVLTRLAARGCATLDLDRVAHELMAPGGAAYDDVVARFGPSVVGPDGQIDRKALGALAFADAAARADLNAIVHPKVRVEQQRRLKALAASHAVVVVDAALLVESGVHLRFDRLLVVDCDARLQLRRLMQRDGLDEAAARARLAAQMPGTEKRAFGHVVLDSSGSLEDASRAADGLAAELAALAASRPSPLVVPRPNALGALLAIQDRGPRGLTPLVLLEEMAAAPGLELERLARRLVPPADGPWYRSARAAEPGPGPETLVAPLVLWSLATRGPDQDFLVSAAASLARLTHVDATARADACLVALAVQDAAVEGRIPADLPRRLPAWSGLAERWGGARPSDRVAAVLMGLVAQGRGRGPSAAASADPALDALFDGLTSGTDASRAPERLAQALDSMLAGSVG
jgi:dephospho-CoA kinase